MDARPLTQLIRTTSDLDYVERFQTLAKVNLEMRNAGPTADRLLRKAVLEIEVGNYAAGLEAARDAITMDGTSPEAHYQAAVAHVLLAYVRIGALPLAPGAHQLPGEAAQEHLRKALDGFREAVRLNPVDDEARDDVHALERILERHGDEQGLSEALRASLP